MISESMAPSLHLLPYPPPDDPLTLLPPSLLSSHRTQGPEKGIVCLDNGDTLTQGHHAGRKRWSLLCPEPEAVLRLPFPQHSDLTPTQISASLWQKLRAFWNQHRPSAPSSGTNLEQEGGMIGMISAEAGLACEGLTTRHRTRTPLLIAMICTDFYLIDRQEQQLYWVSETRPPPVLPLCPPSLPPLPEFSLRADLPQKDWEESVRVIQDFIARGDIFQANLTMRWHLTPTTPLSFLQILALYRRLRQKNPAPFGALMSVPGFALLSASVERFLSLSANGQVETRPIKGTAPLSAAPDVLAQDEKERAENIMITDLMRHDIGRVCTLGSVTVPQLCTVERFTHLYHLVSCVQGQLRKDCDAFDLLAATLPPGSVTGAPKHRALEIIDQVETSPREAYCGTLFRLGWNGELESSVLIRSLNAVATQKEQGIDTLTLGAGGGITFPSHPRREYEEMYLKAAPLLDLFRSTGR